MIKVNIKNYKGDYVCYYNDYSDVELIGADDVEEIKKIIKEGIEVYGTIEEKVFGENFIQKIQDKFEEHADEYGYPDMNWQIDYNSKEFEEVKEAIRSFIESLGDTNKCYFLNENVIIEVGD